MSNARGRNVVTKEPPGSSTPKAQVYHPKTRSLSYLGANNLTTVSAPKIFKIEQPMTNAERYEKNQRTLGQSKDFGNANSTDNLHNDGEELSNDQIKAILDGRVAQRSNKEYAPTKIKNCLNMDSYYVHYSHPINVMLRDYNDFTKIVFKILNKKRHWRK